MRLIRKVSLFFVAIAATVVLTSAVPATTSVSSPTTVNVTKPAASKLTYSDLKKMATEVKGAKLTLKEKIALKVFGKKIASKVPYSGGGKSQVIALILCALLGGLGIHRFYLGYTWQGIVQLLTAGGCGIWALIDLIRIITGSLQPKDGEYETTL